jgi:hypothetical protein
MTRLAKTRRRGVYECQRQVLNVPTAWAWEVRVRQPTARISDIQSMAREPTPRDRGSYFSAMALPSGMSGAVGSPLRRWRLV